MEVLPPGEQPYPLTAAPDPLATDRDAAGRLTSSAAARALARLPRRSRHVPRKLACDPRFEPHNLRRLEWQRKRVAELQASHGHVSHGVGAMVNAAGWLYAGGEFAAELAAEQGNAEGFKQAGTLTATARQHDLAAWELAQRESGARANRPGQLDPELAKFFTAGDE